MGLRIGQNIAERTTELAKAVIEVSSRMPKSTASTHVAKQLVRAATAIGANYEEARGAESRADFVHKLGLAAKEARETIYWLELVRAESPAEMPLLARALEETQELAAILFASRRTAMKNAQ